MRNGLFGSLVAVAIVVAVLSLAPQPGVAEASGEGVQVAGDPAPVVAPSSFGGCPAETLAFHRCALEKAKTFDPPRTPGGKPDMEGYWQGHLTTNHSIEGVSETEPRTREVINPWKITLGMIVDPPDRKIPYQQWAAKIGRKGENFQKYIDPRTACASGGVTRVMQYSFQLLQRDDYIAWLFEDHHAYRIIATNGQPHPGKDIKLFHGDAVGRWEGNTLVVDVTNLNGYNWLDDAGNFYTDAAHLVERLTMIDPDTIHYEITLEDPKAYTRPWKMAWVIARDKEAGAGLLEEACWEGERDVPKFLELGYTYYFGAPWRSR